MKAKIQPVNKDQIKNLRDISISTFKDSYEHLNNPEDFKSYLKNAFSNNQLSGELENPNSFFYFILYRNKIAGYFKLNLDEAQTEFRGKNRIEIERIYVKNEFQGFGLGKEMINFTRMLASDKNKNSIWLGVWENNPVAIAFYEYMGFKNTGKHIFKIGNDPQTDLIFELKIK